MLNAGIFLALAAKSIGSHSNKVFPHRLLVA
uniref:Uncharacterized protein n=1 Tax=Arundo donax TaxID=35708 RepID=A0A0A9BSX5_ARUDO